MSTLRLHANDGSVRFSFAGRRVGVLFVEPISKTHSAQFGPSTANDFVVLLKRS